MLVLAIWVVGLLVALAGCLSYAELSVNLLRSGGEYVYLREAWGPAANGPLKKALREGRILIFIDESGLSLRPHRCRTWAPRGQTPVLQYNNLIGRVCR